MTEMKLNKFANLLVIGLVLTVAASGCRKKPVGVDHSAGILRRERPDMPRPRHHRRRLRPENAAASGMTLAATRRLRRGRSQLAIASNSADAHAGWTEDAQTFKSDTVHFDFDSSVSRPPRSPRWPPWRIT